MHSSIVDLHVSKRRSHTCSSRVLLDSIETEDQHKGHKGDTREDCSRILTNQKVDLGQRPRLGVGQ